MGVVASVVPGVVAADVGMRTRVDFRGGEADKLRMYVLFNCL